jgi:hypothetical protein
MSLIKVFMVKGISLPETEKLFVMFGQKCPHISQCDTELLVKECKKYEIPFTINTFINDI